MTTLAIDVLDHYQVAGQNVNHATAHATCAALSEVILNAGQVLGYTIYRSVLSFDTSIIPALATISRVYLKLSIDTDNSVTDFDVGIGKYDWSASDPVTLLNMETVYDGSLATGYNKIWQNTNGLSLDTYYESDDLDIAWINQAGITYYSLLSSRDVAEDVPLVNEDVGFDLAIKTPQLIIEYTLPTATISGIQSITGIQSIKF